MPTSENSIMKFKNFKFKQPVPFIMYCDLESILEKYDDTNNVNTVKVQKHTAFSIAYYLHCSYNPEFSKFNLIQTNDCINEFGSDLHKIAQFVDKESKNIKPMETLSDEQVSNFNNANICHICGENFTADQIKVHDHCHLTGKFRGAAHQSCNLNYINSLIIPIVFHNLSGYDTHF